MCQRLGIAQRMMGTGKEDTRAGLRWLPLVSYIQKEYKQSNSDSFELYHESESEVAQSCPTLCDPVDCSLPGSSVYGILQARIMEWIVISFCRGSSPPRDKTQVSCAVGRFFTTGPSGKPHQHCYQLVITSHYYAPGMIYFCLF